MLPSADSALDQIRRAANPTPRISLTELSRSTKWRENMVEYAVIELCDHNDTAGYLVSPIGMQSILERLAELEHELEEAQFAAIVAQRGENTIWETGEQLANSVSELLDKGAKQEVAHAN